LRLGFDLDGTVADMHTALAREAKRLFPEVDPASLPTSAASADPSKAAAKNEASSDSQFHTNALSSAQQRELWKEVCAKQNFWESLAEIEPGALARLYAVAQERKWEIIFLTSRPESAGDNAQAQSHRWLVAHGFLTPSIFVVHGTRGKIASALALDVFVDDRPENCLDISIDSSARPILVWRGQEENVPLSARQLGIGAVTSIAQCLDILEDLDRSKESSGGLVSRLKSLLGLKPKAPGRLRESSRPTASAAAR
jgi:hypothetical protein